jgi:hypothetical protein
LQKKATAIAAITLNLMDLSIDAVSLAQGSSELLQATSRRLADSRKLIGEI